jgi:hypothetical protein
MDEERIEIISQYLFLSGKAMRDGCFFLAGDFCRLARLHAAGLPAPVRQRALLLCESTREVGERCESLRRRALRHRKRGSCQMCGERGVVIHEVRRFGFYADWACTECARDIEGATS